MNGFYAIVLIGSIIAMLVTICLGRVFKDKPIVKYLPAVAAAVVGIGFYIKSVFFSTGFEDLGYVVLTLIACIVFFISFITAFIMGLLQKKGSRNS